MPPIFFYECASVAKALDKLDKARPGKKTKLKRCGHHYDVYYQNQAAVTREEPGERCPKCGSTDKERLVNTGTSFILKGSGWAKDRYSK
jgi:predicted nucleic acid-binding Zn ribbon protein